MTGDTPREPDARDPTTSRGDGGEAGVEQQQTDVADGRTSEEGGDATPTDAIDTEGAALGGEE